MAEWEIGLMSGVTFLAGFYMLFMLSHVMDWSLRTISGGKHGLIVNLATEKAD
jgi:hypothetical protein